MNATITKNRGLLHVNLYLADRAYGGAAEGGWWYDTGNFITCMGKSLDPTAARIIRDAHKRELDEMNEGRRPISSVLSTGIYEICIEPRAGENYPKYRPYYE